MISRNTQAAVLDPMRFGHPLNVIGAHPFAPERNQAGRPVDFRQTPARGRLHASPASENPEIADAKAAGYAEGYAAVRQIFELCQIAGKTDLAGKFLSEKKSAADVRKALTNGRDAC